MFSINLHRHMGTNNMARKYLLYLIPFLLSLSFFAGDCNKPESPPATPTNLKAEPTSSTEIKLTWSKVNNAVYYNLFDGKDKINKENITDLFYNHTGLAEGSPHKYTLTACNNNGCSAPSDTAKETTKSITVTAEEHPKGTGDIRDRYGVFSIKATEAITDYMLAVVKANDPAPNNTAMESGSHIKRNIGVNSKYVLMSYALSATLTGTATVNTLLEPSSKYFVYGMKVGGTPSKLLEFNTNATITSTTTPKKTAYMDSSISYITISARAAEKIIMPIQFQYDWTKDASNTELGHFIMFINDDSNGLFISINGITAGWNLYDNKEIIKTEDFVSKKSIAIRTMYYDISYDMKKTGDKDIVYYRRDIPLWYRSDKLKLFTIEAE